MQGDEETGLCLGVELEHASQEHAKVKYVPLADLAE
jgi:hypothetical protein